MTWRSHNGETLLEIHCGDALAVLKTMPSESVHMCVTSPPYWSLRDYGTATWEGGDSECDHSPASTPARRGLASSTLGGGKATTGHQQEGYRSICAKCGARRIDDQIGLEDTPEAYVARLVEVFREVRRVLRADGVLFLVIGDSYASSGCGPMTERTQQYRLRSDLTPEQQAYVLSELARAAVISDATQEGRP